MIKEKKAGAEKAKKDAEAVALAAQQEWEKEQKRLAAEEKKRIQQEEAARKKAEQEAEREARRLAKEAAKAEEARLAAQLEQLDSMSDADKAALLAEVRAKKIAARLAE